MKKYRDRLNGIDFNLILQYLCKHGLTDKKRDKITRGNHYAIQPLRISVGSGNHNYVTRYHEKQDQNTKWNFMRDLPRYDCGVRNILNFNEKLAGEIGKLMDFEGILLKEKWLHSIHQVTAFFKMDLSTLFLPNHLLIFLIARNVNFHALIL